MEQARNYVCKECSTAVPSGHKFCGTCGIKSFYVPRSNPDGIDVNVRCLDPQPAEIVVEPFDGRDWELLRVKADFTPLDFSQRYTGRLSDDGKRIDGRWESSNDGQSWDLDFRLNYLRLA